MFLSDILMGKHMCSITLPCQRYIRLVFGSFTCIIILSLNTLAGNVLVYITAMCSNEHLVSIRRSDQK